MDVGAFLGVGNVLDVETVSDIGIAGVLKSFQSLEYVRLLNHSPDYRSLWIAIPTYLLTLS